jgi:polyphenol oxidase
MPPSPFHWHGEHLAVDLPAARALFTTRRGGCSRGSYASLNLGRWTDDDPADVLRNRESLQQALAVRFAFGRQVHGTHVQRVTEAPGDGSPKLTPPGEADGQLTALSGVAPMVLTADCLPIAIAGGGAVGMLHAGWRGLAGGIIARGIEGLRELAGSDAPVVAAVGPGAGPCCYQVSEDVHGRFAEREADLRHGRNLDLKAIARLELQRAGASDIHDAGLCTICSDPSLFYSHRREDGVTGRQAGIAWLTS